MLMWEFQVAGVAGVHKKVDGVDYKFVTLNWEKKKLEKMYMVME